MTGWVAEHAEEFGISMAEAAECHAWKTAEAEKDFNREGYWHFGMERDCRHQAKRLKEAGK